MINFRTDMADERLDVYKKVNNLTGDVSGIETFERVDNKNVKTSIVKITNDDGAKAIGKPVGTYITFDLKNLKYASDDEIENASNIISEEIKNIVNDKINKDGEILVVGLGNRYVTADSLGPKVIEDIEITRHLLKYAPECVVEGARSVSGIAPGVLGTTGIETLEVIKGVVDNIKPKLIIVIDSLASKSIERISSTIQLANTGIVPGAGVGNERKELSEKTLGIPVIAIGVPMVVELATLVSDGINVFIEKLQEKAESNSYLNNLKDSDKYEEVKEALSVGDYNMIVTPKEIDDLIESMGNIVSKSINNAI